MRTTTLEERKFVDYKMGRSGSFTTSLYDAYFKADTKNSVKLLTAFPELNVAYHYSNTKGYWKDLVERYNEQFDAQIQY